MSKDIQILDVDRLLQVDRYSFPNEIENLDGNREGKWFSFLLLFCTISLFFSTKACSSLIKKLDEKENYYLFIYC